MSNWRNFRPQSESKPDEGKEVGGVYQCQTCNEFVTEAVFFAKDKTLKYRCKNDHVSFLEGFKVFF